jgi:rod shape determining protein RodA
MSSEGNFLISRFFKTPWGFVGLVTFLGFIGVAMLYSAAQGSIDPWAERHLKRFIVGFIAMIIIGVVNIKFWFRYSYLIYFVALGFLIMVEVMGFIGMGAQRWINIAGFNFQPSELMKVAVVLVLARYFHNLHLNNLQQLKVLMVPLLIVALPVMLILKQPNLGTATIISMMSVALFFAAGVSIKKFIFAGVLGAASLPVIWHFMHSYQKRRVLTFLDPEADPLGAGYNIIQSKIAIGSGSFWGKGFLQGTQSQLSFLPEKQTDFIFTMLAEEFGLIGGLVLLATYAGVIILGIRIAVNCYSHFGKLMGFGIITMMFLHIFINMAMTMGMIPVVGVPLPLLSYGGSNLLATLIGFGFVLNAHIHSKVKVGKEI